ncbi:MAG: S8 family serine peptidase [Chloroflexi bacterium]|nr:S8 family serine peptidase [Chloroflexota bacterium]
MIILLVSILGLFSVLSRSSFPSQVVYVEPGLAEMATGNAAVIVTAVTPETAAQSVAQVDGQITSDLWLINAVGAILTPDQLNELTQMPGIIAVTANKSIAASGNGNGNDNNQGRVTDRWRTLPAHGLVNKSVIPAALLPDGGAFLISEYGDALIVNADGSERARFLLADDSFKTKPAIAPDGTIFIAGTEKYVYALNPDGSAKWTFEHEKKIEAGATLTFGDNDHPQGVLYIGNEEGVVRAINAANGALLWSFACDDDAGKIEVAPVVSPDGTVYILSEKGHLLALDSRTASVAQKWIIEFDSGDFTYIPVVDAFGTIYLAYDKGVVAVKSDGTLQYHYSPRKKASAQPVLAANGTLLVPAGKRLYALNPNGSVHFEFVSPTGGKFEAAPVLSPDGNQIYAVLKEKNLYAVDAATGALLWEYGTDGDLEASPVVAANGYIHLGMVNGRYTILDPSGEIIFTTDQFSGIKVSPTLTADENAVFLVTESNNMLETVTMLPDSWDGPPDVQATDDPFVWDFLSPVSIDVGANELHDAALMDGNPITGDSVTVAVVDSGIRFDQTVKNFLGAGVESLFLGQADFTNDGACLETGLGITQHDDYCWANRNTSWDPYGHGSHVAGIMWNQFTDADTGDNIGIAPGANVLSVRVLGGEGQGTYEDVIEGIQYVVANKDAFNIRVLNLSLSGLATTPYFADPLNQAVEAAWAEGIVVLAAAGNDGPAAQSVSVPGNDPYVITVGAVDSQRTPGYWADDVLPSWSATGPTLDGFIKPDVLAPGSNVVSFMYNDPDNVSNSAYLVQQHPDYSETASLFRMNGTSMATAVASGVAALILEAHPNLTPDQVKYRLMATARTAVTDTGEPVYSVLQQGIGRIWAPDAVLADLPANSANGGLDLQGELSHLWTPGDDPDPAANPDLAFHYQGPVQRLTSDDRSAYMYYIPDGGNQPIALGIAQSDDLNWLDPDTVSTLGLTFDDGQLSWSDGYIWAGGTYAWSGGTYAWSGGTYAWSGGTYAWSGGTYAWSGGTYAWSGGTYAWSGGTYAWSGGTYAWSGDTDWADEIELESAAVSATTWVNE